MCLNFTKLNNVFHAALVVMALRSGHYTIVSNLFKKSCFYFFVIVLLWYFPSLSLNTCFFNSQSADCTYLPSHWSDGRQSMQNAFIKIAERVKSPSWETEIWVSWLFFHFRQLNENKIYFKFIPIFSLTAIYGLRVKKKIKLRQLNPQ